MDLAQPVGDDVIKHQPQGQVTSPVIEGVPERVTAGLGPDEAGWAVVGRAGTPGIAR
jgi:hypothetical protein